MSTSKEVYVLLDNLCNPGEAEKKTKVAPVKTGWRTEAKCIENCGAYSKSTPNVFVTPSTWAKVQSLLGEYPSLEWLAYLVGKKEGDDYMVTDLVIPKQEMSASTVDLDRGEIIDTTNIVGSIHSHHNMGAFFSATDEEHIVPNGEVSIVVSTSGCACRVKETLPCGNFTAIDAKLSVIHKVKVNLTDFVAHAKTKLATKVYTYQAASYTGSFKHTCICCGEEAPYSALTWKGGGWYCKSCLDKIGDLDHTSWLEVTNNLKSRNIGVNAGGVTTYFCAWCKVATQATDMIKINGVLVCKECFTEVKELEQTISNQAY